MKKEHFNLLKAQKDTYKNNLQNQMLEGDYQRQSEKQEDIRKDKLSSGFEFECYTRDQLIANERRNTTDYLKNQQ